MSQEIQHSRFRSVDKILPFWCIMKTCVPTLLALLCRDSCILLTRVWGNPETLDLTEQQRMICLAMMLKRGLKMQNPLSSAIRGGMAGQKEIYA